MTSSVGGITLKSLTMGFDAIASNETVAVNEERNYYGRNTLTVNNLDLNGASNLTARNQVQVNSEFHAKPSISTINNETHIFLSEAFPDCPIDFAGYMKASAPKSIEKAIVSDSKEIEVKFNSVKDFQAYIFPNPSNGAFSIRIDNPLQNEVDITLSNLLSEKLWQKFTKDYKIFHY